VTFEIVQKLVFHNQNGIKSFSHLIVAGFAVEKDFSDVVDWPLHLVDVSGFLTLYYRGHTNNLGGYHDVEEVFCLALARPGWAAW
jgi:hypothetical protein